MNLCCSVLYTHQQQSTTLLLDQCLTNFSYFLRLFSFLCKKDPNRKMWMAIQKQQNSLYSVLINCINKLGKKIQLRVNLYGTCSSISNLWLEFHLPVDCAHLKEKKIGVTKLWSIIKHRCRISQPLNKKYPTITVNVIRALRPEFWGSSSTRCPTVWRHLLHKPLMFWLEKWHESTRQKKLKKKWSDASCQAEAVIEMFVGNHCDLHTQ